MKKGFTLIELLVVISIIGILAVSATSYYGQARKNTRDLRREADLGAIQSALELYYADNKNYPAGSSLGFLITDYMSSIPTDPLNKPDQGYEYRYVFPANSDNNCQKIYALYTKVEISNNAASPNCIPAAISGNYLILNGGN